MTISPPRWPSVGGHWKVKSRGLGRNLKRNIVALQESGTKAKMVTKVLK